MYTWLVHAGLDINKQPMSLKTFFLRIISNLGQTDGSVDKAALLHNEINPRMVPTGTHRYAYPVSQVCLHYWDQVQSGNFEFLDGSSKRKSQQMNIICK